MTTWLPRGLVFAAGMVLLRLVQGTLINTYPTSSGTISVLLMAIFCVGALIWGFVDGMADAGQPGPGPAQGSGDALVDRRTGGRRGQRRGGLADPR